MAHEWAEELADLAKEHHRASPSAGRIILTRAEMAAGKRASTAPPMTGDVRPAGEGRWMRFDGEHWGPSEGPLSQQLPMFTAQRRGIRFAVSPDVMKELDDKEFMSWFETWTISGTLTHVSLESIVTAFNLSDDLLRGDSDE